MYIFHHKSILNDDILLLLLLQTERHYTANTFITKPSTVLLDQVLVKLAVPNVVHDLAEKTIALLLAAVPEHLKQ